MLLLSDIVSFNIYFQLRKEIRPGRWNRYCISAVAYYMRCIPFCSVLIFSLANMVKENTLC